MKLPESIGRLPLGLKIVLGAIAVFLVLSMAKQANAQSQCGPEDQVAQLLGGKYNEAPVFRGVAANGALIVMWTNESTGTWTTTVHNGAGVACIVASGDSFETLSPPPNI